MIKDSKDKMMDGAPNAKTYFHFGGDNIWYPKAVLAETIQEAEQIWHKIKVLIPTSQTSQAPAETPPDPKVEDKSIDTEV